MASIAMAMGSPLRNNRRRTDPRSPSSPASTLGDDSTIAATVPTAAAEGSGNYIAQRMTWAMHQQNLPENTKKAYASKAKEWSACCDHVFGNEEAPGRHISQFTTCNFSNLVTATPGSMVASPMRSSVLHHNARASIS